MRGGTPAGPAPPDAEASGRRAVDAKRTGRTPESMHVFLFSGKSPFPVFQLFGVFLFFFFKIFLFLQTSELARGEPSGTAHHERSRRGAEARTPPAWPGQQVPPGGTHGWRRVNVGGDGAAPWTLGIAESGVTNRTAGGRGGWERDDPRTNQRDSGGNGRRPDRWGGGRKLVRAVAARGQRPHTVDTSVPLPLLTARGP